MSAPPDFARKLDLVIKALSMSRGRLAQESGLDKSLIGRWVAGSVRPSGHNLERVTQALARRSPGFSMLDWELPPETFAARFGGMAEPVLAAGIPAPGALVFPFDVTGAARAETAKRGDEYAGIYYLYRRTFGRAGRLGRVVLMLRPRDGLLEARKGLTGFEHRGWALLMLNRLYIMLAEEKFESMAYMITNAGQQPRAGMIGAISLSVSSDGLLMPKAAPSVMVRVAEVTGDIAADDAAYEALKATGGVIAPSEVPPRVLDWISRDFGPAAQAKGGSDVVTAPFLDPDD